MIGEVLAQCSPVEVSGNVGNRQDCLQLGGEEKALAVPGVHKGLDPDPVARDEEMTAALVPDGEGEHPPEAPDAALAPCFVGAEDDLGVRSRAEDEAERGELGTELPEIVDLAVEGD